MFLIYNVWGKLSCLYYLCHWPLMMREPMVAKKGRGMDLSMVSFKTMPLSHWVLRHHHMGLWGSFQIQTVPRLLCVSVHVMHMRMCVCMPVGVRDSQS